MKLRMLAEDYFTHTLTSSLRIEIWISQSDEYEFYFLSEGTDVSEEPAAFIFKAEDPLFLMMKVVYSF
jgi:hypothetical protein